MSTSIPHLESSFLILTSNFLLLSSPSSVLSHPSPFLRFLLKVGCSMFYVGRLFSVLIPLHLSRELYKSNLFMQNKANLQNAEMNVTPLLTKGYENLRTFCRSKNKAKQTQNKPNFSPKLASFFPILALFLVPKVDKEIFAFAKTLKLFEI